MNAEEIIRKALDQAIKSQSKRDDLAADIVEALWEGGYPLDGEVTTVEVSGARVPVERVEAYGLNISLDANGNAVEVESPYGLAVAA